MGTSARFYKKSAQGVCCLQKGRGCHTILLPTPRTAQPECDPSVHPLCGKANEENFDGGQRAAAKASFEEKVRGARKADKMAAHIISCT